MYRLGHGDECIVWLKWTRECVCRGCETDAVRRPAARPFVQDAQSAVRLPVSGRDEVETDFQAVARHFGRRERIA